MSKDRQFALRLDAELDARLEIAAKMDRRTKSQLARNILADGLAKLLPQHDGVAA
jgi:predicted transcriptional regulator